CWSVWDVVEQSPAHVTLELELARRYGYPFHLRSRVSYRLTEQEGLTITIATTNIGGDTAPYGSSTHPYLSCDGRPVDECVLQSPARSVLAVDERLSPREVVAVADLGLDLPGAETLGSTRIDHAFTDLPGEGWTVSLSDPETGL